MRPGQLKMTFLGEKLKGWSDKVEIFVTVGNFEKLGMFYNFGTAQIKISKL